jgi:hypothetical protein
VVNVVSLSPRHVPAVLLAPHSAPHKLCSWYSVSIRFSKFCDIDALGLHIRSWSRVVARETSRTAVASNLQVGLRLHRMESELCTQAG